MFSIRHRTASLALAAAALAATLAPAAAQAKQRCQPAGSHTITANGYARVYAKGSTAVVCIKASGKTTVLQGADPASDQFALGGKYVGWSSNPTDPSDPNPVPHSILTVMHISDRQINDRWYPFSLNESVDKIVVIADGAAAWSMTPPAGDPSFTMVQGTDRANHPADQFSDDHTDMVGSSLHLISGKTVGWSYTDGTTGTQSLF